MSVVIPRNPFRHGGIIDDLVAMLDRLTNQQHPFREPDHPPTWVHLLGAFGGDRNFGWWTDPHIPENYPDSMPPYGVVENMYPHYGPAGHVQAVAPVLTPILGEGGSGTAYYLDEFGQQVQIPSLWGFFPETAPQSGRLPESVIDPTGIGGSPSAAENKPTWWIVTNGIEADNAHGVQGKFIDFVGFPVCVPCEIAPTKYHGASDGAAVGNAAVVMSMPGGWDWSGEDTGNGPPLFVYGWHSDPNPVILCLVPVGCGTPMQEAVEPGGIPTRLNEMFA